MNCKSCSNKLTQDEVKNARQGGYPNDFCSPCRKEWKRNANLLKRYGLNLSDYKELLASQEKKCKICNVELLQGKTVVDHCHTTGAVRGLLCYNCNFAIGALKDDVQIALRLVDYLYQTEKENGRLEQLDK